MALNRADVFKVLPFRAVIDVRDSGRVDVHGINEARRPDAFGCPHCKPSGTGADISDGAAGLNVKDVHHAIDLKLLIAIGIFKCRKIAGIRRAGWPLWRSCAGGLCLTESGQGAQQKRCEQESGKDFVGRLHGSILAGSHNVFAIQWTTSVALCVRMPMAQSESR